MADKDDTFLRELCRYHVSGQLKVAPEHVSDEVLQKMGKPYFSVYCSFVDKYQKINQALGMKQYLVPYLMSSHPGSTLKDAIALAEYLRTLGYMPEQVQDFYPTPSTISTCMYYTGLDAEGVDSVPGSEELRPGQGGAAAGTPGGSDRLRKRVPDSAQKAEGGRQKIREFKAFESGEDPSGEHRRRRGREEPPAGKEEKDHPQCSQEKDAVIRR